MEEEKKEEEKVVVVVVEEEELYPGQKVTDLRKRTQAIENTFYETLNRRQSIENTFYKEHILHTHTLAGGPTMAL